MTFAASLLHLFLVSQPLSVNITLDKKPVSQVKVEVFAFRDEERLFNKEKITNAAGKVVFDIDTKGDYNLILRANYQGVPYFSEILFSKELPKGSLNFPVYKAVPSDLRLVIKDLKLFFSAGNEVVTVDEEILIENSSPFTITGAPTDHGPEVFRIGLAGGTHELKFGPGFEENTTRFEGNDIISTRPLLPGITRVSMRYLLERSAMSAAFNRKFNLPVKNISVGSDISGIKLSGVKFTEGAPKFFAGKMLPTFTAKLGDQKEFSMGIHGLPLKYRMSQVTPFVGLILMLLFLLPLIGKVPPEESGEVKKELLKKLLLTKKLRKQDLIDETEFQRRRLKILERLVSFYETQKT